MYRDVPLRMSPMEWIEEDLRELARADPDFPCRKDRIVAALDNAIQHGDMDRMAALRRNKRTP